MASGPLIDEQLAFRVSVDRQRRRSDIDLPAYTPVGDPREVQTTNARAKLLLNLVYDPQGNRLLGVDQGIDRDKPRNNYLGQTYTRRSSGHQLFALDADSGKVLAKVDTDQVPIGLLLDAQQQRIYVTNRNGVRVEKGAGTVTIFDARSLQRINTLALPPHPNSLALDEANHALFVTVKNDGAATKAAKLESVVRISAE